MTSIDLTTALTRLLSDRRLRDSFAASPESTADELCVEEADRAAFVALDPEQLGEQAEGLVAKRFHEVAHLLPWTMPQLGKRARGHFQKHADEYWPDGHRRHVLDAVRFCQYLVEHTDEPVNRYEMNCMRFLGSTRRFALHFASDYLVDGSPRFAIQLLYRNRRGQPVDVAFPLAFPRLKRS